MATIPNYQRQAIATGIQQAPSARSAVPESNPLFAAVQNLGQQGAQVAGLMAREEREKAENRASMDVANTLAQGDVFWQEDFTRRTQAWKPGDADLRDGIGKDFDKWVSESAAKLPTEASRNYFQQHTAKMKARLQTSAFSYQEKTTTDKLNADNEIGMQADASTVFNDPSRQQEVYARRMETLLARSDLSDADKIKTAQVFRNQLAVAAHSGELERDPEGWLMRNGLMGSKRAAAGQPLADDAGTMRVPVGEAPDGLWKAQIGQESGGKQFGKDGKPLTSSAGAVGIAQVMPGTGPEAAKLAGLPWDVRRYHQDAGYNEALGKAYMAKQLQTFGGDVQKALAAYNMGPGSAAKGNGVAGLVAKHGENWLAHAPKETQNYVASITKAAGMAPGAIADIATSPASVQAGGGAQSAQIHTLPDLDWKQTEALRKMAEQRVQQNQAKAQASVFVDAATQSVAAQDLGSNAVVNLEQARAEALAAAEQRLGKPLDAQQRASLDQAVERQATMRERDRKRAQENTSAELFDALDKNGGDFQDLRRQNPAALEALPRETRDRLEKYAGQVALGYTRETDWQAYAQLVEDPKLLTSTNLQALRDKFSATEYGQLVKMQQTALKAQQDGNPDQTIRGDMDVVRSLLNEAGVTSKTKQAQFFSVLQGSMDAQRQMTGVKHLRQEDVKKLASDLLVKEVTSRGFLWDSKERAFNIEVPAREKTKIMAALNEAGLPVNDATILRAYRNKLQRANQ